MTPLLFQRICQKKKSRLHCLIFSDAHTSDCYTIPSFNGVTLWALRLLQVCMSGAKQCSVNLKKQFIHIIRYRVEWRNKTSYGGNQTWRLQMEPGACTLVTLSSLAWREKIKLSLLWQWTQGCRTSVQCSASLWEAAQDLEFNFLSSYLAPALTGYVTFRLLPIKMEITYLLVKA